MARTTEIDPNQGTLLQPSAFSSYVEHPVDPDMLGVQPEEAMHSGSGSGPVVDLVDRANQLKIVTDRLAKINQTRGLSKAIESGHRSELADRYGGDPEHVLYGAEAKHGQRMTEAKIAFARASGMWAMINSGLMTPEEARASTAEDFRKFLEQFADDNQPNRLALRRQQARLVKKITKPKQ